MTLDSAMKKHGVSAEDIAKATGLKVAMIKAVIKGRRLFHPKRTPAILGLFKGDVTLEDLYGDHRKSRKTE